MNKTYCTKAPATVLAKLAEDNQASPHYADLIIHALDTAKGLAGILTTAGNGLRQGEEIDPKDMAETARVIRQEVQNALTLFKAMIGDEGE